MLKFKIKKVAVLGAGVMGAQIAAHFTNAGIITLLYDLPSPTTDKLAIVKQAIKNLTKLKPSPLATTTSYELIIPMNYATDLPLLKECDLIIEAVAEKFEIKQQLYTSILPHLHPEAIIATNTSGLSINDLKEVLPQEFKQRFCGMHFFNPPRYMHLVELIPAVTTKHELLDQLETFLVSIMGKGVIRAKDTPNFIANRIGVFSLLATIYHAQQFDLSLDVVDALTGTLIGRPASATFRTIDIVGLDTMMHVVNTMATSLLKDPWHQFFVLPAWMQKLIQQGALGQKTGVGIYKKQGSEIFVLDLKTQQYRPSQAQIAEEVVKILHLKSPVEKFQQLLQSSHPQAKFLLAYYCDLFHYTVTHLGEIAETCRDIDLAMRWGFGWQSGPFETWQQAGFQNILRAIEQHVVAKKTMSNYALPNWLYTINNFYQINTAWSVQTGSYQARSQLPVYQRQIFKDKVLAETDAEIITIFENDDVKMWHQDDGLAILSFKTKLNTISDSVLDGVLKAIKIAEQDFKALILWQFDQLNFSVGANLKQLEPVYKSNDQYIITQELVRLVSKFQKTAMALRYSFIPTVAAVRGRAFGGGCELTMHCDKTIAAFETYLGLVEVAVGLLPAGGGSKEFARRAVSCSRGDDPFHYLQSYFKTIAMAEVSTSALDAKVKGYLTSNTVVVMNPHEVLGIAKIQAHALAESNYLPPIPRMIPVIGREGIATLQMKLINMLEGGYISEYDYLICSKIAEVMCGGDLNKNELVDEEWFLRLEREAFVQLALNPKTQQRIQHMLETGKALRN